MSKFQCTRKVLVLFLIGVTFATLFVPRATLSQDLTTPTIATPPPDEYYLGRVREVKSQGIRGTGDGAQNFQVLAVEVLEGPEAGEVIEITYGGDYDILDDQLVEAGERVVLFKTVQFGEVSYFVYDTYRLPPVAAVAVVFFVFVVAVARWRGAGATVGLFLSLAIIAFFIIPQIIAGRDPVLISFLGSSAIAIVSLVVAHGWKRRTGVALVSTLLTLTLSVGLAFLVVALTKLTGLGSEEAFYLQVGPLENVNLRGLLLGAIIIGTLGVLDDVTTSQVAAVEEISRANTGLSARELYHRGLSVGRDHIAAVVNTLALAYAGASFPLFLVVAAFPAQPLWVTLNREMVIEEIVRTLVGSAALVAAVPVSTLLAAYVFGAARREN